METITALNFNGLRFLVVLINTYAVPSLLTAFLITYRDLGVKAAPYSKVQSDSHLNGLAGICKVVQNSVSSVFLDYSDVRE